MAALHVCQVWWTLAYKPMRTRRHKSRRTLCQGRSVRACVHSVGNLACFAGTCQILVSIGSAVLMIISNSMMSYFFWPDEILNGNNVRNKRTESSTIRTAPIRRGEGNSGRVNVHFLFSAVVQPAVLCAGRHLPASSVARLPRFCSCVPVCCKDKCATLLPVCLLIPPWNRHVKTCTLSLGRR